jgi:hypothetical protein
VLPRAGEQKSIFWPWSFLLEGECRADQDYK